MNHTYVLYQASLSRRLARNARAELFLQRLAAGDTQPVAWQHVNLDANVNDLENKADLCAAAARVLELFGFDELPKPEKSSTTIIQEEDAGRVMDDSGLNF